MELNTEINRVFGHEMAKIFASTINDEEIAQTAKRSWEEYVQSRYTYKYSNRDFYENESQASFFIKQQFAEILKEEVKKIVSTDEFKDQVRSLAESIVDDIVVETRKKMVEEVSGRLAGLSTGYQGIGLQSVIEQTVYNMLHQ